MNERVKIINAIYDEKRDIVKLTIKNISQGKECFLVFPGSDLGSFVGQLLGQEKNIAKEHREIISKKLIGIEFNHIIEGEIKSDQLGEIKKLNIEKMQYLYDVMNKYPYKEILESMEEEEK